MKRPFRSRPEPEHPELADEYDDGGLDTVGLASGALGRSILGGEPDADPADYGPYRVDPQAGPAYPDRTHGDPRYDTGEYREDDYGDPGPRDYDGPGYDEPGYDGPGYDEPGYDPGHDPGYDDPEAETEVSGPGVIGRRLRRGRRDQREPRVNLAPTGESPSVPADTFSDGLERYRHEAGRDQRSAWAYLTLLAAMFATLTLFGWACTDETTSDVAVEPGGEGGASGDAINLVVRIEGEAVSLEGAVPDEAARTQLVEAAAAAYGADNVVDELELDPTATFDAGTLRLVGTAVHGDERPEQLQGQLISQFGLEDRGLEISFVDEVLSPVSVSVELSADQVVASGQLPDEQSVADLTTLLTDVFEVEIDASGLTVGATTWTEGRIVVTGTVTAGDPRVSELTTAAPDRLATLVTVDTSALPTSDDPAVVAEVQAGIAALVTDQPIQFAPDSADIVAESDPVLIEVAALLNQVLATPVEVVGHTDDVGEEEDNQALSEARAASVVDRLAELGVVADRMTSRGEGESNPIADNTTDEGKAANRRIEFVLTGASGGG
jgi:outer membrane protein OmpA-like peptidoglycan-associated protein